MGSIEIHVSAIRIARYFCIDIGIALATFQSIVYRYRFSPISMYHVSVSLNANLEYRAHHCVRCSSCSYYLCSPKNIAVEQKYFSFLMWAAVMEYSSTVLVLEYNSSTIFWVLVLETPGTRLVLVLEGQCTWSKKEPSTRVHLAFAKSNKQNEFW